jgi:thymidylate synthase (FAD)
MKLIKPSFEIIEQQPGLEGIYKQIEQAGRTCYKSEDKITEDSAKGFVDRMIKSGHGAMLEHGTVYLSIPYNEAYSLLPDTNWVIDSYGKNPYSIIRLHGPYFYVTTNYRVLVENGWLDDLKYLCEPAEHHAKRITVKFIMDRIGSQSFCRHRVFSFAQESTRYCNYSRDKFNNEVTFILPCWVTDIHSENSYDMELLNNYPLAETENMSPESIEFIRSLVYGESSYFTLLEAGWKPQQARTVLPNALKTELVMTGFINDWKHFFDLRCATNAHPQAQELAIPLREEFVKKGYITDNK